MGRQRTADGCGPAIRLVHVDYLAGTTHQLAATDREDRLRLQVGARGPEVEALQDLLNELGERLPVDGVFGPATHASVVRVQLANGLDPDGVVDDHTWDALEALTVPAPTLLSFDTLRGR